MHQMICLLLLFRPKATEILQKLTDTQLTDIPYYNFTIGAVAGVQDVIISNTGYTDQEVLKFISKRKCCKIVGCINRSWRGIRNDSLRISFQRYIKTGKGFCLYGNDIDDTTSPIEAGLGWITKFDKDFVSKEVFAKQKKKVLPENL